MPKCTSPLTLSKIQVSTLEDELNTDGDCSLREAMKAANTNLAVDACLAGEVLTDTVTFAVSGTIGLTATLPAIQAAGPLVIDGGQVITVSGVGDVGVFAALIGAQLTLRQVNVLGGLATSGAGLYASGANVTLESCRFTGNVASFYGGAVYSQAGTLAVRDSQFIDNRIPTVFGTVSVSATLYSLTSTAWSLANVAPLTLTLSDAPDPTTAGQPFTVTVVVTSAYGLPTGVVTITAAGQACTITLSGGAGDCLLTSP
jgi:CSLREA domain-containing protein